MYEEREATMKTINASLVTRSTGPLLLPPPQQCPAQYVRRVRNVRPHRKYIHTMCITLVCAAQGTVGEEAAAQDQCCAPTGLHVLYACGTNKCDNARCHTKLCTPAAAGLLERSTGSCSHEQEQQQLGQPAWTGT
jgi:hypothetical protein